MVRCDSQAEASPALVSFAGRGARLRVAVAARRIGLHGRWVLFVGRVLLRWATTLSAVAHGGELLRLPPTELAGVPARPIAATLIQETPRIERLPPPANDGEPFDSDASAIDANTKSQCFPPLPPDPNRSPEDVLPALEEELWEHGGSQLYAPEGDRLDWPEDEGHAHPLLRLPEDWQKPEPFTLFQEFLGADPIRPPAVRWPGAGGFAWEPRLVAYGSYELFAIALEENNRRQDGIGHQMLLDVDFRITGTERAHVQWRPLGRKNTGGSFWQLNDPSFYDDNSTGIPDRYWVEAELYSVLGGLFADPFVPRDYNIVVGKYPLALHNNLLINDDILGIALSKNSIYLPPLSNLNVQAYYAFDDVDAFVGASADVVGMNLFADWRAVFIEASIAYLAHGHVAARDATYAAISATKFFGPLSLAGRGLFKWGDDAGRGDGQLVVLESNYTRLLPHHPFGVEETVWYVNAFRASSGWNSISGGNFNRIRSTFAVNPLVQIAASTSPAENYGVAAGVQLFRKHADESIIPEVAIEAPDDRTRWGVGLRYLRKTGRRTYLEVLGVINFSEHDELDREGVFISHFFLL